MTAPDLVARLQAWCAGHPETPPAPLCAVAAEEPTVGDLATVRADVECMERYMVPRAQLVDDATQAFATDLLPRPDATDLLSALFRRSNEEYLSYRRRVWPAEQTLGPLQRQLGLGLWLLSLEWAVLVARSKEDPPIPSRPATSFAFVRDTMGPQGRPGIGLVVARHMPGDADTEAPPVPLDHATFREWDTMVSAFIQRLATEGLIGERAEAAIMYWDALWLALPRILTRYGIEGAAEGDDDDDDDDGGIAASDLFSEAIDAQLRAWGLSPEPGADDDAATLGAHVNSPLTAVYDLLVEPADDKLDEHLRILPAALPFFPERGKRARALALQLAESRYYVHTARLHALWAFTRPAAGYTVQRLPATAKGPLEASQALAKFVEQSAARVGRLTHWRLQDVLWSHIPTVSLLPGEPERHVLMGIDRARHRLAQIRDRRDDERAPRVNPAPSADQTLYDLRQDTYTRVCGAYTSAGVFKRVLREWWPGGAPHFDGMAVLLISLLVDDDLARHGAPGSCTDGLLRSPHVYLDELRHGSNQGDMDPPQVVRARKRVYKALPSLPPATPRILLGRGGMVGFLRLYQQNIVVRTPHSIPG
jgi:hypothetical protein